MKRTWRGAGTLLTAANGVPRIVRRVQWLPPRRRLRRCRCLRGRGAIMGGRGTRSCCTRGTTRRAVAAGWASQPAACQACTAPPPLTSKSKHRHAGRPSRCHSTRASLLLDGRTTLHGRACRARRRWRGAELHARSDSFTAQPRAQPTAQHSSPQHGAQPHRTQHSAPACEGAHQSREHFSQRAPRR